MLHTHRTSHCRAEGRMAQTQVSNWLVQILLQQNLVRNFLPIFMYVKAEMHNTGIPMKCKRRCGKCLGCTLRIVEHAPIARTWRGLEDQGQKRRPALEGVVGVTLLQVCILEPRDYHIWPTLCQQECQLRQGSQTQYIVFQKPSPWSVVTYQSILYTGSPTCFSTPNNNFTTFVLGQHKQEDSLYQRWWQLPF